MTTVVTVRFKEHGRTYYFDPRDFDLQKGDYVLVETVHGLEIATVASNRLDIPDEQIKGELKPVLQPITPPDGGSQVCQRQTESDELMAKCQQKIVTHGLDMRLVKAEYNEDRSRLTFYFTAEHRVDFRMLVRDLARTFRTRIELRQIGPRDEAKLLGGIGICGRPFCCSTFLPNYARVSIKMAKDQDLPLNPSKISGVCGRLLCCLSYEHEQYLDLKEGMPRRGMCVYTPDGRGEVVEVNVLQQMVVVRLAHSGMQEQYPVADLREATAEPPPPRRGRRPPRGRHDRRNDSQQYDHLDPSSILALLNDDHNGHDGDAEDLDLDAEKNCSSCGCWSYNDDEEDEGDESHPRRRSHSQERCSYSPSSQSSSSSSRGHRQPRRPQHRYEDPSRDTSREHSNHPPRPSRPSRPSSSSHDDSHQKSKRPSTSSSSSRKTSRKTSSRQKKRKRGSS